MTILPFYYSLFVRGGSISPNFQYLGNAGYNGRYWSSTHNSNGTQVYNLSFDGSGVDPSYNYGRYFSLSLRCLAR